VRFVVDALVVDALVTVRLVPVALPNESTVVVAELAKKLVVVPFVNTVDEANTTPVFEIPKNVVPEDEATLRSERFDVEVALIVKR
jgi:hypothetical protein